MAFMDMAKAYYKVDKEAMWQILEIYGAGGKVLTDIYLFTYFIYIARLRPRNR